MDFKYGGETPPVPVKKLHHWPVEKLHQWPVEKLHHWLVEKLHQWPVKKLHQWPVKTPTYTTYTQHTRATALYLYGFKRFSVGSVG